MKKLTLLLVCGAVLLTACGKKEEEAPSVSAVATGSSRSSQSVPKSESTGSKLTSDTGASGARKESMEHPSSAEATKEASRQAGASSETTSLQPTSSVLAGQSSTRSSTTVASSVTPSPASLARDAAYNGLYYSVQGKYGEVLIVNKKHPLAAHYHPGENPTAVAAYWQLVADMRNQGFVVSDSYSGFRSYDYQAGLYQNYVNRDGQAAADRYSARPGYSEHQTGLAFDLIDGNGALLEDPTASAWLANNAHHYGFVVRYLPGKEQITGYMPESWHIRYIGPEATEIYQSGLTLEEYYGVSGGGY